MAAGDELFARNTITTETATNKNPSNSNSNNNNNNSLINIIINQRCSPSNSQGSSTDHPHSTLSPLPETAKEKEAKLETDTDTVAMDTRVPVSVPSEPDNQSTEKILDGFEDFTQEEILKYQKYETEFASRLRAKYFSNQDIYGGDIFEVSVKLGDETVRASRFSPTQAFADPKQSFVDREGVVDSGVQAFSNIQNGNITSLTKSR